MRPGREHHMACAGFSLIEVLVTMALVVILMGTVAPRLPVFLATFQLGGAAREIALTLQRARMKAVAENAFSRVVFGLDGTYLLQRSTDGSTFVDDGPPHSLPIGVEFTQSVPAVTFNRLGTLIAAGQVSIANTMGQRKTIAVNLFGRITVS